MHRTRATYRTRLPPAAQPTPPNHQHTTPQPPHRHLSLPSQDCAQQERHAAPRKFLARHAAPRISLARGGPWLATERVMPVTNPLRVRRCTLKRVLHWLPHTAARGHGRVQLLSGDSGSARATRPSQWKRRRCWTTESVDSHAVGSCPSTAPPRLPHCGCTSAAPWLHLHCPMPAPQLYLGCVAVPRLYLGCTSAAWLYLGCTSAA